MATLVAPASFATEPAPKTTEFPKNQNRSTTPTLDEKRLAALHAHRQHTIGVLENYVLNNPKSDELRTILYELGMNYFEEARYLEIKMVDPETPESNKKEFEATARRLRLKSIQTFERLITQYPRHPEMASILFILGDTYTGLGQHSKAARHFKTIVTQFPESREARHSELVVADSAFDAEDFNEALRLYQRVESSSAEQREKHYARYKQAWCYTNLQQHEAALAAFRGLIAHGVRLSGDARKNGFFDEALNDIVIPFAERYPAAQADAYFSDLVSGADLRKVLFRLASLYLSQSSFAGAESALQALIRRFPTDRDLPQWYQKLIEVHATTGRRDRMMAAIGAVNKALRQSSAWRRANPEVSGREALDQSEATLRKLVTTTHARAQKSKSRKGYEEAASYYRAYLKLFPSGPKTAEMRFYLAESLYAAGRKREALAEYQIVSETAIQNSFRPKAVEGMLAILEEQSPAFQGDFKQPKHRYQSVAELPSGDRMLVTLYRAAIEEGEGKRDETQFKLGTLYFYYGLLAEAEPLLKAVAQSSENPKVAKIAANRLLDSKTLQGDLSALADTARELKASTAVDDSQFRADLSKVEQQALFNEIEAKAKAGRHAEAAAQYEAFVRTYPRSLFIDKAYANSVYAYLQAGDWTAASRVAEEMGERRARSDLYRTVLLTLAQNAATIGEYELSAQSYGRFVRHFPRDPEAAQGLFNAIIFKQALTDVSGMVADGELFLRQYRSAPSVGEVALILAFGYRELGEPARAVEVLNRAIDNRWGTEETELKARLMKGQLLKGSQRAREFSMILAAVRTRRQSDLISAIAAEAKFHWVQASHQKYSAIALDAGKVETALKRKVAALDELKKEYTEVIKFGEGLYGVAALVRLGDAFVELQQGILDSPIPASLTDRQAEKYRVAVKAQADGIAIKAREAYTQAIAKAYELQLYSEWLDRAVAGLVQGGGKAPVLSAASAERGQRLEFGTAGEKMALAPLRQQLLKKPTAKTMNALGLHFLESGKAKLAELTFTLAQKLFPKSSEIATNWGVALVQLNRRQEAVTAWTKAVRIDFRNRIARENLGKLAFDARDERSLVRQLERLDEIGRS